MDNDILIIHPKSVRGEDGYRTFSIRIKESLINRIENIAAQTDRSRNELIATFLTYALDHCVIEEEPVTKP